ncbi:hypothetical protein IWW50_003459 [Coemansia erecta]|nr:hypothetical protein IWW50_003459 [Coemansia erecta]
MSEEGEAEFDAGQIAEDSHAALVKEPARGSSRGQLPTESSNARPAGMESAAAEAGVGPGAARTSDGTAGEHSNSSYRRADYVPRYEGHDGGAVQSPSADRRFAEDEYYRRRGPRSRSRSWNGAAYYDSRTPRRRESRADEGVYHGATYRQGRYGDRDSQRGGYYRRYEREPPRYKRRESGRSGYSRGGYPGRDEAEGEYAGRRDSDKDRAIEELRSRVRAGTDRPADEVIAPLHDQSRSASRPSATTPISSSRHAAGASEAEAAGGTHHPAAVAEGGSAEQANPVNMDDLEEGEHVEGAMDVDLPQETRYPYGSAEAPLRSSHGTPADRSRSRNRMHGDSSRPHSRSGSRPGAYPGPSSYEMDRRSGSYRDYPGGGDGAYRRKYDDRFDRHDYRSREPHGGRSGYGSRYADDAQASRYSSRRSPDPREGSYRADRRHHSSRYDRQGEGDAHRPPFEDTRSPHRLRSRSPPPPPLREDGSRGRSGYEERYRREDRSASRGGVPRSRSPRGYPRGAEGADAMYDGPSDYRRSRYADSRWPGSSRHPASPSRRDAGDAVPMEGVDPRLSPPPPPPMAPYDQGRGSPYRGYPPRPSRRPSRTPKGGMHGQPNSRTPYGGRYEHEDHSRDPSNGGHYQGYGSRAQSPGPNMPYAAAEAPPELVLPMFSHGTDLYISRQPESSEWLEVRQQVREQTKRILELTAKTRKSGFELSYSDWGVLKADGQMQVALWQVERAEQGLGASDRSLIDTSHNDL